MRPLALVLIAAVAAAACSGSSSAPPPAKPAAPAKPQASSSLDALPIAQYFGHDDATGQRVSELLRASGIESSAGGSLGYSVWVSGADRSKARAILLAAAATECLEITLFADQAQVLQGTRPATCPGPVQQPAAPGQSRK